MALVQEKSDRITRRDPNAIEAAVAALAAKFGNRLVTSRAVREQHANTTSWIANEPPDAVVFPQATDDVQDIVRICARLRVPVIPFGTGTSLEGHINAPYGGVSIRSFPSARAPRSKATSMRPMAACRSIFAT